MSYILDALKKSEQARGLRKALGLLEASVPSPSLKSVARWPYFVAFALVLNAGFFVFWLHPWHRGANSGWNRDGISGGQLPETGRQAELAGPPAPLAQTGEKPQPSESRPEEKENSALNPPAANGVQAVSSVTGKEEEDKRSKKESVGQTAQGHVGENKIQAGGPVAKEGLKTEAAPREQAPARLSSVAPGESPTTEAAIKKPDGSKLPQNQKAAGTKQGLKTAKSQAAGKKPAASVEQPLQPGAGSEIISDLQDLKKLEASSGKPAELPAPKWHELAPEIREAMPNIVVSMLIYSKKPEERWININGFKKREGQEVSSGLKVELITRDGAILSYRGQRFFKGIVGD